MLLSGCKLGNGGFASPGSGSSGGGSPATITVSVMPNPASVRAGNSQQFAATVSGSSNQAVSWSVNAIAGGNASVGTITSRGLYTAPAVVPNANSVTIQATSAADSSASGSDIATLLNPSPSISTVSPLSFTAGSFTLTINGTNFVSGAQVIVRRNVADHHFCFEYAAYGHGHRANGGNLCRERKQPESRREHLRIGEHSGERFGQSQSSTASAALKLQRDEPRPRRKPQRLAALPGRQRLEPKYCQRAGGPEFAGDHQLHRREHRPASRFRLRAPTTDRALVFPYVIVGAQQAFVPINFTAYGDESDQGPMPVPADAPIEGYPNPGSGDRHVLVLDNDNCWLYELYSSYPGNNGAWNAGSAAVWDLVNDEQRPLTWTSADAAGLSIFAGLVRYDEVAAGQIKHAIRFTSAEQPRGVRASGVALGGKLLESAGCADGNADAAEGEF